MAEDRRRYLLGRVAQGALGRDRRLARELRESYDAFCQLGGWALRRDYGAGLCEAHHVRSLNRGGPNTLENLVLVRPDHHHAIYQLDGPSDLGTGGFVFGTIVEPLTLRQHELLA